LISIRGVIARVEKYQFEVLFSQNGYHVFFHHKITSPAVALFRQHFSIPVPDLYVSRFIQ